MTGFLLKAALPSRRTSGGGRLPAGHPLLKLPFLSDGKRGSDLSAAEIQRTHSGNEKCLSFRLQNISRLWERRHVRNSGVAEWSSGARPGSASDEEAAEGSLLPQRKPPKYKSAARNTRRPADPSRTRVRVRLLTGLSAAAPRRKRDKFTGEDGHNKQEAADVDTKHCGKGLNGCTKRTHGR